MADLIYGVPAKSTEEYYVAKALWKLKHSFEYQVPMLALPGVRGGQIIDFLVTTTAPLPTPIFFHGEYWHAGAMGSEDAYKMAVLTAAVRGIYREPVIIWGKDVASEDEIYRYLTITIGPP